MKPLRAPMPTSEVLTQLIEIGRTEHRASLPAVLGQPNVEWSLPQRDRASWMDVAVMMPEDQLRLLIRGLVVFSKLRGRALGGSVSPVIWLFHVYANRFPECEPNLTRWVVANRVNPNEPFGTCADNDASSWADYLARRAARAARRDANMRLEKARQDAAADRRRMRSRDIATFRLAAAVRRGDQRKVEALLAKGGDPEKTLPEGGSLLDLAVEHGHTDIAELLRARGIR